MSLISIYPLKIDDLKNTLLWNFINKVFVNTPWYENIHYNIQYTNFCCNSTYYTGDKNDTNFKQNTRNLIIKILNLSNTKPSSNY